MQTFKSIASVEAVRQSPLYATLKDLVVFVTEDQPDYRPEDIGYLVLIEPGDVYRILSELDLRWRLADVPRDGAQMRKGLSSHESTDQLRDVLVVR